MEEVLQTIAILTILDYIPIRDISNFVHCGLDFRGIGTKSVFLYHEHDGICIRVRNVLTHINGTSRYHYLTSREDLRDIDL